MVDLFTGPTKSKISGELKKLWSFGSNTFDVSFIFCHFRLLSIPGAESLATELVQVSVTYRTQKLSFEENCGVVFQGGFLSTWRPPRQQRCALHTRRHSLPSSSFSTLFSGFLSPPRRKAQGKARLVSVWHSSPVLLGTKSENSLLIDVFRAFPRTEYQPQMPWDTSTLLTYPRKSSLYPMVRIFLYLLPPLEFRWFTEILLNWVQSDWLL